MSNALAKAFSDVDRCYSACKASVANATSQVFAQGPGGSMHQHKDLFLAKEQLLHYTGWVFACIRPIAERIAGQPIRVGRTKTPKRTKDMVLPSGFRIKQAGDVEALEVRIRSRPVGKYQTASWLAGA